jgi:membrane AbrB-like protein
MIRYPIAAALALGGAAGALCSYVGVPLPWMIGPLVAMTIGRFSGLELLAPRGGREAAQVVIGCALGLYFTPIVAREVLAYWPLLVAAALLAVGLACASGWFLSRTAGLDSTTAIFASVPGGAAEMTILGERFGALPDRVALAQSIRIVIVVLTVPAALTYFGVHGADAYRPGVLSANAQGLAGLLALGAAAGWMLGRLRMPNAWMLGPLGVTIALTVGELHLSAMPTALSNAAQVLIGCALGSRVQREFLGSAPRFAAMVCISVVLAIVLSALIAYGMAVAGAVAVPTMVLATAPGGMAEMCITAKVLQLGVPLVTAAHVTRVLILVTTTGPLFRLARNLLLGARG